ncbi:hypothetical protein [Desulfosporosinus metallidurans]|uniref:Uncharacterized protein n=1 Tax=Desulfosporosinus metallidurans TaxID=1888891 RepID=A0A1Q8QJK3_9FIRM|nr:hypothetical protein [Desulfosporosinus metallidurans]OLN27524.1 hypothetical protein DSOL_4496 [Desulfosporosinus metallidurans]
MRKLKTSDIFSLSKIAKKMDIKKEIASVAKDVSNFSPEEKAKAEATMQSNIIMIFIENIGSAEKEVYKFLADISGSTPKEIEDMELPLFLELIKELFSGEGIGSFFSSALK